MLKRLVNLDFPKENINFIFDNGGLGDHVCNMVAIKYIKDHFPWITIYLYVPDFFVDFAKNLIPDMIIRPFSKAYKFFNSKQPGRHTAMRGHDSLSTHLVDFGFHSLANRQVEIHHKNYLKLNLEKIKIDKFDLSKDYIVITTGYTAKIREMPVKVVNELLLYFKKKNINVVFLGNRQTIVGANSINILGQFNEKINYNEGIDLIGKTNLLQAGKIISQSKLILGCDNGLHHIAGCTEIPIVASYTSVEPRLRLPYRHNQLGWNCYPVEPPDSEPEKYCQSRWDFVYDHDYRHSYCGNDNLINSITSEMFIEQLEKVL